MRHVGHDGLIPDKAGVIMEVKVAAAENQLESKAWEALEQIETKAYITEFQKRKVTQVWKYGIAFCGKHVHKGSPFDFL